MNALRWTVLVVWLFLAGIGCEKKSVAREVVVYTSVDDVFARPVAERFQKNSGITVKLVPDTEETKSTGLLNRLIAEKPKPVADVFWSGDPMRAAVLKAKGISAPYKSPNQGGMPDGFSDPDGHWSALSARARVILVNRNLVPAEEIPSGLQDFLNPKWKGKICLANPLFGTTSMHAAALFEVWGEEKARVFFEGLSANGAKVLSSNGEVKRRVSAGDFAFGLTDTDDANEAMKDSKPVSVVYPDAKGDGTLIMTTAAVLIHGGPNTAEGKQFIDFLLTAEVEAILAVSAAQMPLRPGVEVPAGMKRLQDVNALPVSYDKVAARIETLAGGYLKEWAGRQ
jgi:iron(III) transport system substrate-binding protein